MHTIYREWIKNFEKKEKDNKEKINNEQQITRKLFTN